MNLHETVSIMQTILYLVIVFAIYYRTYIATTIPWRRVDYILGLLLSATWPIWGIYIVIVNIIKYFQTHEGRNNKN